MAQRVTMNQLVFQLETELTKLETNISVGEILLKISSENKKDSLLEHGRNSSDTITVNKEYLSRIQSDIHLYHYRIVALRKAINTNKNNDKNVNESTKNGHNNNQQYEQNDAKQVLNKANKQIKKIEDMFGAINTAFIKQITPNSEKLLKDFDKRTNGKYNPKRNEPKEFDLEKTVGKYGKVVKDGYLIKQGHVRKSWKKRLFILTSDGYLRYYDTKQRLLNEIDLSTAKFLSVETEHSHYNKPFVYVNCIQSLHMISLHI